MNPFDKKSKMNTYGPIERGTTFVIPVTMFDEIGRPIVNKELSLYFTLKKEKFDYDYDDDRALIKKDGVLVNEINGKYEIKLSSRDTWLPPGTYYFDIMLKKGEDTFRLYTAETSITEAPSNRYQTDGALGAYHGETIVIGDKKAKPINVTLPGTFVLDYQEMPLTASPKFLLQENSKLKTKEIQHFTSRMRFPLILQQKIFDEESFIFDAIAPFNFKEGNPLGNLKIKLHGDLLSVWAIPLKAAISFFGDDYRELKVGQQVSVHDKEQFTLQISFENHILSICGKRYGATWPLTVEWYDFNK